MNKITPWEVQQDNPDQNKLIEQFGCDPITTELINKYELNHRFFRRNIVFAHRDFEKALNLAKNNKSLYLYTGRGPSSKSLHLGHAIPFLLCKYLQEKFNCKLIIQITDDEKYLWKDISLKESIEFGIENVKDIISFGFDSERTYIFSNYNSGFNFLFNTLRIEKMLTVKEFKKVFGFTDEVSVGKMGFPASQMAPCFASSFMGGENFDEILEENFRSGKNNNGNSGNSCENFGSKKNKKSNKNQKKSEKKNVSNDISGTAEINTPSTGKVSNTTESNNSNGNQPIDTVSTDNNPFNFTPDTLCLIPASIDQDPYFRLARDISNKLNSIKPATVYTYFLPSLKGINSKMSASCSNSSIYLSDSPEVIRSKIRNSYSGGRDTLKEHKELGGDTDTDISYQYLKYFLEDDKTLEDIRKRYSRGEILSGEIKEICIKEIQKFISEFQERRKKITVESLRKFYEMKK